MEKKKILWVKAANEVLSIKKEHKNSLDEEILRLYLEKNIFKNKEEKIISLRAANLALKFKRDNLSDKEVIQKVLDSFISE